MRNIKWRTIAFIAATTSIVGVAYAAGDWSAARNAVEAMKQRQMTLRKVTPEETAKIVTAVCEADKDDRKKAGEEAANRVADLVKSQMSDLARMRDDANRGLDDVIADESLKDRHNEAKEMKDDVTRRWTSIEKMTKNAMRGANHPLVSFLISQGQAEHTNRQRDCDAKEIVLESGRRVDCLMASGETCLVIELKPDNSRSVSKGTDQARGYARELNDEMKNAKDSKVIQRLIGIDSDFGRCRQWEFRIDCYKLCPKIDEEGEFREIRADWRNNCS